MRWIHCNRRAEMRVKTACFEDMGVSRLFLARSRFRLVLELAPRRTPILLLPCRRLLGLVRILGPGLSAGRRILVLPCRRLLGFVRILVPGLSAFCRILVRVALTGLAGRRALGHIGSVRLPDFDSDLADVLA